MRINDQDLETIQRMRDLLAENGDYGYVSAAPYTLNPFPSNQDWEKYHRYYIAGDGEICELEYHRDDDPMLYPETRFLLLSREYVDASLRVIEELTEQLKNVVDFAPNSTA